MEKPTQENLKESIDKLNEYKSRLSSEVIAISRKLRISKEKVDNLLQHNPELKKIDSILKKLASQYEKNHEVE